MLPAILPLLASLLATKGFDLLKKLLDKATDVGIEKAGEFIERKSGIPLVDHSGNLPSFSEKDLKILTEIISTNKSELESILLEKEKLYMKDKQDARYLQKTTTDTYAEVVKTKGREEAKGLWLSANFIYVFAIFVTLLIFSFIFFAVFGSVADEKMRFVDITIGNLFGTLNMIIGFFFGSAMEKSKQVVVDRRTPPA